VHQLNADFLFEIPDLPAERWLRSVQLLLGGNGQAARISHCDEVAEMPELHSNLPYLTSMGPAYKVFFRPASRLYSRKCTVHGGLPGRQGVSRSKQDEGVRMRKGIKASLLFLLVMTAIGEAAAQSPAPN
jgi:hypothetical protein